MLRFPGRSPEFVRTPGPTLIAFPSSRTRQHGSEASTCTQNYTEHRPRGTLPWHGILSFDVSRNPNPTTWSESCRRHQNDRTALPSPDAEWAASHAAHSPDPTVLV